MKLANMIGILYLGLGAAIAAKSGCGGGSYLDCEPSKNEVSLSWSSNVVSESWKVCWKKSWAVFATPCHSNEATVSTAPTHAAGTTIINLDSSTKYKFVVSAGGWTKSTSCKTTN